MVLVTNTHTHTHTEPTISNLQNTNQMLKYKWTQLAQQILTWYLIWPSIPAILHLLNGNWLSSVQSLGHVPLFATPWNATHQASLSITNSWSSLRLTSIESVMPSSHLILDWPIVLSILLQWSYFKSWKVMLWKCCTPYASKYGKLSSGHRTGNGQFSFPFQRKAMQKNA